MNLIEYVKNCKLTFKEWPLDDVDSLALCQIFYGKLEYVLDGDVVDRMSSEYELKDFYKNEYFDTVFNDAISDEENEELMRVASGSRRFRNLKLKNMVSELDATSTKQFAAVCFELDDNVDYVCFRGTDGTMLGWREDFELAFKREAPSQADAVRYIETYYGPGSPGENKKIYIGGHSKGGNLAVYAGLMCNPDIHRRIVKIFSHDGPGFLDEVHEKLYEIARNGGPEVEVQVPQGSIVGMLLSQVDGYSVIKSKSIGISQHSAFNWEVEGGCLVTLEHVSKGSEYVDRTVQTWLMMADDEHRASFIAALFKLLSDNGISTVHELREMTPSTLLGMRRTFGEFDGETQRLMELMIKNLAKSAIKEFLPEGWEI